MGGASGRVAPRPGAVDPTEEKLVAALAVAMWKEIRADRTEAGVLTRMTDEGALGRDLGDKRNALSLGTAIRYGTAAGMATQRAHRAFLPTAGPSRRACSCQQPRPSQWNARTI